MLIKAPENRKSLMWELAAFREEGGEVPGWRRQSLYSARSDSNKIPMSGRVFLCVTWLQEIGGGSQMEIQGNQSDLTAIAALRCAARIALTFPADQLF